MGIGLRLGSVLALGTFFVLGCGDDDRTSLLPDASTVDGGGADGGSNGASPGTLLLEADAVPMANGFSAELEFDVPDNAVSVVVNIVGAEEGFFTLALWVGPDDVALVTDGWTFTSQTTPQMCLECPNRVIASEATGAVLAPNNPGVTLVPGTHRIAVFGFSADAGGAVSMYDGPVDVTVHAKLADAPPTDAVLDLDIFLSGAGGWTAEDAASNEALQAVLSNVGTLYAQAGVRLGTIEYRDVPEEFRVIDGVMGVGSDLSRLFQQGAVGRQNAVNLFFVDELMLGGPFGGFALLLGVAGGIPGPTLIDTPRSGVVINVTGHDMPGNETPIHVTVAHELGHYLGLFHASEMDNPFMPLPMPIHDPLDDTAENDPSNMMFYQPGGAGNISASQGLVLRLNPWLRAEGSP